MKPEEDNGRRGRALWGKVAATEDVGRFLVGPQPRWREMARTGRILLEFVKGFRALHFVGPCVTVFGSARFTEENPYYQMARETAARLALNGFTVMTGGGPGIMEAANRGAREAGGRSVGCNIELPREQSHNDYLDRWVTFRYFFVRKVMLVKYSYAFVLMPGGFGTLDEVFETATLVQTHKISDFPLVLMGSDYWGPLLDFMRTKMVPAGTIDEADAERFFVTDSPEEAADRVLEAATGRFGLAWKRSPRPIRILGERGHGPRDVGSAPPR